MLLRGTLTLLISLPQLLPPGICVCRRAPSAIHFAVPSVNGLATTIERTQRASCPCHGEEDRVSQRTQEATNGLPLSDPDRHHPKCPAESGPASVILPVPKKIDIPVVIASVHPVLDYVDLLVQGAARAPVASHPAGEPPVYIALRSLLI